jgi:hypothetical protein
MTVSAPQKHGRGISEERYQKAGSHPRRMPSCSWRDGHLGRSVDAGGVIDGCGYRLISGRHKGEAVGPRMGTCIRGSEAVLTGKDSGWIGTSEANVAVDNRVPLPFERRSHGNSKGETRGCGRGSREIKNRMRGSAP